MNTDERGGESESHPDDHAGQQETPSPADVAEQSVQQRRRRRRRAKQRARRVQNEISTTAADAVQKTTQAVEEAVEEAAGDVRQAVQRAARRAEDVRSAVDDATATRRRRPAHGGEAGSLRSITGGGASRVGVEGAMRARDVSRPNSEDLARAERDIEIVRRNAPPKGP